MSENSKKPDLIAYAVSEGADDKNFFTRIGAAWENSKGGFNIKLAATPIDGNLVLLPPKEDSDE